MPCLCAYITTCPDDLSALRPLRLQQSSKVKISGLSPGVEPSSSMGLASNGWLYKHMETIACQHTSNVLKLGHHCGKKWIL